MFICIEGADKTGKSTLAQELAKAYNLKYVHFGKPSSDPAKDYINFLKNLKEPTVCDRFYVGELIYGPILRGKHSLTTLDRLTIERLCRSKQMILIHADTPIHIANKRLEVSTQEEAVDVTLNEKAAAMFKEVIPTCNIEYKLNYYAFTRDCIEDLIMNLNSMLEDMPLGNPYCKGIGTTNSAKIAFVGDKINQNVTRFNLPFDTGMSSKFLADCLKSANVPEKLVYICNSDTLTALEIQYLNKTPTLWVSLGKNADNILTNFNIKHTKIHHPQYVKRFHYKNHYFYLDQLSSLNNKLNELL